MLELPRERAYIVLKNPRFVKRGKYHTESPHSWNHSTYLLRRRRAAVCSIQRTATPTQRLWWGAYLNKDNSPKTLEITRAPYKTNGRDHHRRPDQRPTNRIRPGTLVLTYTGYAVRLLGVNNVINRTRIINISRVINKSPLLLYCNENVV